MSCKGSRDTFAKGLVVGRITRTGSARCARSVLRGDWACSRVLTREVVSAQSAVRRIFNDTAVAESLDGFESRG